jgi:hypothetical protein
MRSCSWVLVCGVTTILVASAGADASETQVVSEIRHGSCAPTDDGLGPCCFPSEGVDSSDDCGSNAPLRCGEITVRKRPVKTRRPAAVRWCTCHAFNRVHCSIRSNPATALAVRVRVARPSNGCVTLWAGPTRVVRAVVRAVIVGRCLCQWSNNLKWDRLRSWEMIQISHRYMSRHPLIRR